MAADWRSYFIIFNKRYQKPHDTYPLISYDTQLLEQLTGLPEKDNNWQMNKTSETMDN